MANPVTLQTPLPAKDLFFDSLNLSERLSTVGEMQLTLLSPKADLQAEQLLGKPLTVSVALRDGNKRHFHGYVTRFGLGTHRGRYHAYQAVVRPWLWFLTRTADCKIFQAMSVPDIVKTVFEDHEVADFDFKLFRSYDKLDYCVQYRETDYNFVARLLEHEGIYWYFEHKADSHKLILVDSQTAHDAIKGYDKLPYYDRDGEAPPDLDHVHRWIFSRGVKTTQVGSTSYNFEKPSNMMSIVNGGASSFDPAVFEFFDYQGDYPSTARGEQLADNRMSEIKSDFERIEGATNAHGLTCGHTLTLARHPRASMNTSYLVTGTNVQARQATGESSGSTDYFDVAFTALPAAEQFRPPRRAPKPFVQGPQSAVVVGPSGEEIYTDKYGRVKVQFHWDRYGGRDENSSCWVRVSHPWAGKNYGAIHTPRIGQEVIVDFLEGDPDQPIITGRVYNAEQMPPWDLPANATQSGILTRSSKGGSYGNANAIRFEDKKGSEQLWIHAEKNQDIEVESDETHSVGHDRSKTIGHDETTKVGHDRSETVGNHETIGVGVNRTQTVGSNETITIGANRSISVGASESATVALQRTHSVGVNETIAIGGAQEVAIGGLQAVVVGAVQTVTVGASQTVSVGTSQTTSIGAGQAITVGAEQSQTIGADQTVNVGGSQTNSIGKARSSNVGGDDAIKVGKNFVLEAADSITLKTGSASISMKKDGTITIKGKDITASGTGKIAIKASGDVVIKGSKIGQN
jgi:type VI secretion system secreted protein VgrG